MGFGNIGSWQLLMIVLIVGVILGDKKLRNIGRDIVGAVKNFRKAMNDENKDNNPAHRPGALDDKSASESGQSSAARKDKHGSD